MKGPSRRDRGWPLLTLGGFAAALVSSLGVWTFATWGFDGVKGYLDSLSADRNVQSFTPSAHFWILAALATSLVCSVALIALSLLKRRWTSDFVRGFVAPIRREFRPAAPRHDSLSLSLSLRARILAILLFIVFFSFYFELGTRLAATHAFERNELMFDSDVAIVIENLTRFRTDHTHCNVHPLFCVLFNPLGILLKGLVGSGAIASVLLVSTVGALTVSCACVYMALLGASSTIAGLWSIVLGLSASQMFFAVAPETYSFAPIGFLALCVVMLRRRDGVLTQSAAIAFVLGITATNVIPALLLALIPFAVRVRKASRVLIRAIALAGGACALVLVPNLVQVVLFKTWPFFLPWAYTSKRAWMASFSGIGDVMFRLLSLVHAILMESFIAPRLRLRRLGVDFSENVGPALAGAIERGYVPTVTVSPEWISGLTPIGIAASVGWLGLLAWCAFRIVRGSGPRHPLVYGLAGALSFQFLTHTLFGRDLFLYSGHWTVLVWCLAGTAIAGVRDRKTTLVGVILLAGLLALNNLRFLSDLRDVFTY